MDQRKLGRISLALTLATFLWVGLVIADQFRTGPVVTAEDALRYVGNIDWLFTLNYLNAALITVLALIWFYGLHRMYSAQLPRWARLVIALVPLYGLINLVVYLSQVTVVPRLAGGEAVLAWVQIWPGSLISRLNALAYAILGIPSLAYALPMWRQGGSMRVGGALLGLSGLASMAGFVGVLIGSPALSIGVMAGGVLFAFALVAVTRVLLKG